MTKSKCEICGGDGTFKTKSGETKQMLIIVPPYPEGADGHIDLRKKSGFHYRCIKCRYKNE